MDRKKTTIFTDALLNIFSEIGIDTVSITDLDNPHEKYDIIGSVGVTGELQGYIMLKFMKKHAHSLIDKIVELTGINNDGEDINQFFKEAIGEILNQISGRSVMLLSETNVECNITPPTILTGSNIETNLLNKDVNIAKFIKMNFCNFHFFVDLIKI